MSRPVHLPDITGDRWTVAAMNAQMMMGLLGLLYGALVGACFASFGCVVSERVPAGKSIGGRSACACGRQLRARENVPVLGWLVVRGRARCCGAVLPVRYVVWEAAGACVGAATVGAMWLAWVQGRLGAPLVCVGVGVLVVFFVTMLVATWQRKP